MIDYMPPILSIPNNRRTLNRLLGFDCTSKVYFNIYVDLLLDKQVSLNQLVKIVNAYFGSSVKPKNVDKFPSQFVKVSVSERGVRLTSSKHNFWHKVKEHGMCGENAAICSIDGLYRAFTEDIRLFIVEQQKLISFANILHNDLDQTDAEY